jgi:hypothetical protein
VAAAPPGHVNSKLTFEEKLEYTPTLIDEGFYDRGLNSYYELFPGENILILIFEEMIADPKRHFRTIYRFLDVSEEFDSPLLDVRINSASSKLGRSRALDIAYKVFYRIIRIPALSRRIDSINAISPPEMNSSTRQYLRQRYAPTIANLERMMGRDLGVWDK